MPADDAPSGSTLAGAFSGDLTSEELCTSGFFKRITVQPIEKFENVKSGQRVKDLTVNLVDTYTRLCSTFKYSTAAAPQRVLTKITEARHNNGWDNGEHDLICKVGDSITDEAYQKNYEILDWLGQGSFGQVIKIQQKGCDEPPLALKVIKNKAAYFRQAQVEIQVLHRLMHVKSEDRRRIIQMRSAFVYRRHLCVAFELLSMNLYDVLKQGSFRGVTSLAVRRIILQILEALRCLKEAEIIHCDLKPENVMIDTLTPLRVKLIDFGSACLAHSTVHTYIQSRFYRSPEVLFGLPYSAAIDMWSLGCIGAELYLGLPIFPGNNEYDQIKRIVDTVGLPPSWMLKNGTKAKRFFKRVDSCVSQQRFLTVEVLHRSHIIEAITFRSPNREVLSCWTRLDRKWMTTDGPYGIVETVDLVNDEYIKSVNLLFPKDSPGPISIILKTNRNEFQVLPPTSMDPGSVLHWEQNDAKEGMHIVGVRLDVSGVFRFGVVQAPRKTQGSDGSTSSAAVSTTTTTAATTVPGDDGAVEAAVTLESGTPNKQKDNVTGCSSDEEESSETNIKGDGQLRQKRVYARRGRRRPSTSWRLKTVREYMQEESKKVVHSKKYFSFYDLQSMISCVPSQSSWTSLQLKNDKWFRESFLQFLLGVLEMNPEDRWTPRMALQHPILVDMDDHVTERVFEPDFIPARDMESGCAAAPAYLDASCAPCAPSMSATSDSASSPGVSSHSGRGTTHQASNTVADRLRRSNARHRAVAAFGLGGAASTGSASSTGTTPGSVHVAVRAQPCGGTGDSSPWHGPSPMSEQGSGTASERIPSSNFSGTESGGELVSRASATHSETSGRPLPNSAHLSDSDNASAGGAEEQRGKDRTMFTKEWLATKLPPRIENLSPRGRPFREALGLRQSGPVVADRGVSGSNPITASSEDQGAGRFVPPARASSGESAGSARK